MLKSIQKQSTHSIAGEVAVLEALATAKCTYIVRVAETVTQGDNVIAAILQPAGTRSLRKWHTSDNAPAVTLALIENVKAALDAAHKLGVVHGDVRPSNIVLAYRTRICSAD